MRCSAVAVAGFLACLAAPAMADTLVDNVDGFTLATDGSVQRFSAVLIDDNGRVEQLFQRGDKRPARPDYKLDGKGRVMIPGLIDSHVNLMALGLALLGPTAPGARPRPEDRDTALAKAQAFLLARGITTVADMGTTIEAWQTYRRAGDLGRLSLRIVGYAAGVEDMILIAGPGPTPWLYEDRLRLNGLHVAYAPPAAAPVAAKPAPAALQRERQYAVQIKNLLSRAGIDGFQAAVTIQKVEDLPALLDSIDELALTYKGERRWRIELPAAPAAPEIARMASGSLVAALIPPVGTAPVAPAQIAAAPLASAKVRFAFGSNGPSGSWTPMALAAPVAGGANGFEALTTGGAWAASAEGRIGRIAPGQRADFLLLDRDPTMASATQAGEIRVLETWVGGRQVWSASSSSAPAPQGPPAAAQPGR